MMEEFDNVDPAYIKGFNEGYLISQHMPELSDQLAKAYGQDSRGQGFQQGKEQYQNEQFEQRMPSWLKYNPLKNDISQPAKDAAKNKSMDRDIEPDR